MRILIAHTDDGLARSLSRTFRQAGLIVDIADGNNPDDVHDYLRLATPYDLLVHTPTLPMRLTTRIPARMTTCGTHSDLYEDGEEDQRLILRKAFAAVCYAQGYSEEGIIEAADIRLHLWEDKAFFKDQYLPLKPMEYRVLRTLCLHKGQYMLVDSIADHLYTPETTPMTYKNIINRFLSNIRIALKEIAPDAKIIQNRYGLGSRIGETDHTKSRTLALGSSRLNEAENILDTPFGTVLLTSSETQILSLLSSKKPLSRAHIAAYIQGTEGSIPVLMGNIRHKMAKIGILDTIATVRGYGYQFCEAEPAVSYPLPAPLPPS